MTLRCVDAALASRLPEGTVLEVVVVDDGSRDGTAEAIRRAAASGESAATSTK